MRRIDVRPLLAVCAWWTLEGLVTAGQLMTMQFGDEPVTVASALRRGLLSAWTWVPLSMLLLACVQRYPLDPGRRTRALAVYAAATALVVALRAVTIFHLNPVLGWYRDLPPFREVLLTSLFNNLLMCWLTIGVWHGLLYARRAHQRERQAEQLQARLTAARLEALHAQLDPHFLFNALNSAAEMVHRDVDAADRMLVGLGELLRSSLDHRQHALVPLHAELQLVQHYLEIEGARLGDRLRLTWDVAPGLDDARVPPLLLQPLAENAIRHAVAPRLGPGRLGIHARAEGGALLLEVSDDGAGTGAGKPGRGTGLANVRSRLECLYGEEATLELLSEPGGGTRARLRLPLRHAARSAA
ncbi:MULTISPECIES: sensor histidine kinase [Myxococcaceae]|uniref:sensor histidine kinase n=1 Tax=Myxococcaceae TaxID=31 RepID=UPI00188DF99B|nr:MULTISPECIES: histidine kinase [Myxococcaceae]MBF5040760.1 histidine kinase [Simulacricoccus sp. 17bor-14]